jgi:hypothetical protein
MRLRKRNRETFSIPSISRRKQELLHTQLSNILGLDYQKVFKHRNKNNQFEIIKKKVEMPEAIST